MNRLPSLFFCLLLFVSLVRSTVSGGFNEPLTLMSALEILQNCPELDGSWIYRLFFQDYTYVKPEFLGRLLTDMSTALGTVQLCAHAVVQVLYYVGYFLSALFGFPFGSSDYPLLPPKL